MIKAVIDTNVFISSLIKQNPDSPPSQILSAIDLHIRPVFSRETFYELQRKLYHRKFEKHFSREKLAIFLGELNDVSVWVPISGTLKLCRDIKDDMILETALLSRSDAIITGDRDLHEIEADFPVKILTPRDFVDGEYHKSWGK